jgi:hypothetical protein
MSDAKKKKKLSCDSQRVIRDTKKLSLEKSAAQDQTRMIHMLPSFRLLWKTARDPVLGSERLLSATQNQEVPYMILDAWLISSE